ncbi:MAG TPA: hypothetical protein VK400_20085, partial [Pyrinomonadaceae bacterium]|nr:hypothetical protein [Pyrinomonadaceae bacterium]
MLKTIFIALLPLLVVLGIGSGYLLTGHNQNVSSPSAEGSSGTFEKMIVANGSVAMDVNLNQSSRLGSAAKGTNPSAGSALRFDAENDSF